MNIEIVKERAIQNGIASVRKHLVGHKLEGALEGLKICQELKTEDDFKRTIELRRQQETQLAGERRADPTKVKEYWAYRYATLQIEYIYEILKVGWDSPILSSKATLQYNKIVQGLAQNN
jgi:hypothetical protein